MSPELLERRVVRGEDLVLIKAGLRDDRRPFPIEIRDTDPRAYDPPIAQPSRSSGDVMRKINPPSVKSGYCSTIWNTLPAMS